MTAKLETRYLVACRLDPLLYTEKERRCLYGMCLVSGAYEMVQKEWKLSPYQAARLVHYAVSRRKEESTLETVAAFSDFIDKHGEKLHMKPETFQRAINLCKRANVLDPNQQKLLIYSSIWHFDPGRILAIVAPLPPHIHAQRAFEAEIANLKKLVWKR